jgi:hypothetical protein
VHYIALQSTTERTPRTTERTPRTTEHSMTPDPHYRHYSHYSHYTALCSTLEWDQGLLMHVIVSYLALLSVPSPCFMCPADNLIFSHPTFKTKLKDPGWYDMA